MANNKPFNQKGIVETIEGDFDSQTGNIAFRATFPNPDGILRHGETGSIIMSTPYKNALIIPQKVTFEILDKKYVYVVGKDNTVKQQEIEVEAELENLFVVSKGLTKDDKILLEGIRKVKNNEMIHSEFVEPNSVISNLSLYAE